MFNKFPFCSIKYLNLKKTFIENKIITVKQDIIFCEETIQSLRKKKNTKFKSFLTSHENHNYDISLIKNYKKHLEKEIFSQVEKYKIAIKELTRGVTLLEFSLKSVLHRLNFRALRKKKATLQFYKDLHYKKRRREEIKEKELIDKYFPPAFDKHK